MLELRTSQGRKQENEKCQNKHIKMGLPLNLSLKCFFKCLNDRHCTKGSVRMTRENLATREEDRSVREAHINTLGSVFFLLIIR